MPIVCLKSSLAIRGVTRKVIRLFPISIIRRRFSRKVWLICLEKGLNSIIFNRNQMTIRHIIWKMTQHSSITTWLYLVMPELTYRRNKTKNKFIKNFLLLLSVLSSESYPLWNSSHGFSSCITTDSYVYYSWVLCLSFCCFLCFYFFFLQFYCHFLLDSTGIPLNRSNISLVQ